jgi:actin-like ATPase involved in cell morphogenesis
VKKSLEELLLDAELVNEKQLWAARSEQGRRSGNLPRTLLELQLVEEGPLVEVLARHLNLQLADLVAAPPTAEARELLEAEFCRAHLVLPFAFHAHGRHLDVAMFDPSDAAVFDAIRVKTNCNVRPHLATPSAIRAALERADRTLAPGVTELQFKLASETELVEEPRPRAVTEEELGEVVARIAELAARVDRLQETEAASATRFDALESRVETALRFLLSNLLRQSLLPAPPPGLCDPEAIAPPEASASPLAERPAPPISTEPVSVALSRRLAALGGPRAEAHGGSDFEEDDVPLVVELSARQPTDSGIQIVVEPVAHAPRADRTPAPSVAATPRSPPRASPPPTPATAPPTARGRGAPTQPLLEVPHASGRLVAIDFGTTRSSIGTLVDGRIDALRLPGGDWDIPSVVGFRRDGTVMLGHAAREMRSVDPANVIASPKRILGRRADEPDAQAFLQNLALASRAGPDREILLESRGRTITVVEVCAHLLHLLRLVAERHLRQEVRDVLLTTPVTFGEHQNQALLRAAELASLNVLELVDEPLAASLSNQSDPDFHGMVAVYDFGGGTFDFSVCEVQAGGQRMVATAGDRWLGGDDLDEAIASAAANAFWRAHRIELRHQASEWQRLLVAAERAKRQLSVAEDAVVVLEEAAMTSRGPIRLEFPLVRAEVAKLAAPCIERSLETCRSALEQSDLAPSDLSAVFLSGGTCYVPSVREAVARFFGKEPRSCVPPERAVLVGAALKGAGVFRLG